MDRRSFIKAALSAPIALGLWNASLGQLTSETGLFEPTSVSPRPRSGWINFSEVDGETLGRWWTELNDFDLPKEFGGILEPLRVSLRFHNHLLWSQAQKFAGFA